MSVTFAPNTYDKLGTFSEVEMNVSNANAWALLQVLGIEPDYSGGIDAADLAGRILLAQGLDEGDRLDVGNDPASEAFLEAIGAGSENGPTVIASPRREGYMAEKLAILAEIASEAARLGVEVYWA